MSDQTPAYQLPFPVPTLTYQEALDALHSTLKFGIQPMLETVVDMLADLGNPDAHFRSVQVAGTNGKTSTSRYAAAILKGEGLRVALYTSPELVSYTERMEVDGAPVSEADFALGLSAAVTAGERVNASRIAAGERPYDVTEFDLLTVAACVVFALARVDVAVLECGMGGRWDATSAVSSIESVAITGIGLDHTRILGDTLEAIAGEKAAIIKPGRTCVLGVGTATPHSVEDVFLDRCREASVTPTLLLPQVLADAEGEMHPGEPRANEGLPHADFRITARPRRLGFPTRIAVNTPRAAYADLAALKPTYQAANIACAVALCEDFLGRSLNEDALYESVISCPTPGRFQLLRPEPPLLIDACHNPQSVTTFLTALGQMDASIGKAAHADNDAETSAAVQADANARPTLLCAVLADKDVDGIVELLASHFAKVACTQTTSPRALPAEELAEKFRAHGAEVVGEYPAVELAVAALCDRPVVACGSITLAGEVAGLFQAQSQSQTQS